MSRRGKLIHEACEIRRGPQGAFATRANSTDTWSDFFRFLQQHGTLPRRLADIPVALLMLYLQHCVARGLKVATVRNRAAEIRVVMTRAGRNLEHVNCKLLGLATRCRDGKKRPLHDGELDVIYARARALDYGFYLLLRLQHFLGLRRAEALRCAPDIPTWVRLLAGGASELPMHRGAKGGRPRCTAIIEGKRAETLALLQDAARYCHAHGGRLIEGRRKNLESSLNRLKALYRAVGLKGEISGHALRYTYSGTKATEDLDRGMPERDVLVGVAAALGHGPERGRFILRTYLLSLADRFLSILQDGKFIMDPDYRIDDRFIPPRRTRPGPARAYWRAHIRDQRAGAGKPAAADHEGARCTVHASSDTSASDGRTGRS